MRQINLKDYASRFSLTGLPIVKVGINFDTAGRAISDWRIENRGFPVFLFAVWDNMTTFAGE